ncbi:hypothetical protein [Marinibacterium profundimaris]|uniref:hypothetical protein n=1 Tax=Marinibacterium profundimaris TaxID=1679460 RepID=UPI001E29D015|nr:hypothetical protein [Marinibacterium profundimaris]
MIGSLVATFAGSAWAQAALRYCVTALAILLFLLALRRSGERSGRLAERLETTEKANGVQRQMLETATSPFPITRSERRGNCCIAGGIQTWMLISPLRFPSCAHV